MTDQTTITEIPNYLEGMLSDEGKARLQEAIENGDQKTIDWMLSGRLGQSEGDA